MTVRLLRGDVFQRLRALPDESVHCVVTSPPYYALRDYGVPGQLGLERTPIRYLARMRRLFREIRRVLRDDGTVWLNIGDSYVSDGGTGYQGKQGLRAGRTHTQRSLLKHAMAGLKPKDLFGIPWMLAFVLRADGWYLRQDIIWQKNNPMPESVRDRCTKSHEYVFLLAKSERYFYDAEAIAEPSVYADEAIYDNGQNGLSSAASHAGKGSSTRKFKAPGGFPSGWDPRADGRSHRELVGRYPNSPTGVGWGRLDRLAGDDRGRDRIGGAKDIGRDGQGLKTSARFGREAGWRQLPHSGNKERKYGADRGVPVGIYGDNSRHQAGSVPWEGLTRNKRSVWTITSKPFKEAHFATFPPELPEHCIKAGTSAYGVCVSCGSPWERLEAKEFVPQPDVSAEKGVRGAQDQKEQERRDNGYPRGVVRRSTIGWAPSCECHGVWLEEKQPAPTKRFPKAMRTVRRYEPHDGAPAPAQAVVLDPFGGSGTTGVVAERLQRNSILIELNPTYADMAERRIRADAPLLVSVEAA